MEEPRIDLWGIVTTPPEPPPFREVVRTPVRCFQATKELEYFRVRLRFLVYALRLSFEVKSVTRLSPIARTLTEHLVELRVFAMPRFGGDRLVIRQYRTALRRHHTIGTPGELTNERRAAVGSKR